MKETNSLQPPPLPAQISNDGREIWDWAAKASEVIARNEKARELRAGIRDLSPRCGTCVYWMQSRNCPRETRTPQGRRSGPSMNGSPCSKHEEEVWVTELRNERQVELNSLLRKTGPSK